ncbi:MAG: hypothetical protein HON06_06990 [Candidatus Puniceispirillum sp.]|nr:hypothetical protein [Candidatus Puniceispirillum sp.]
MHINKKIKHHLTSIGAPALNFVAFTGFIARVFSIAVTLLFAGFRYGQPVRLRHVVSDIRASGIDALPVVILMAATIGIMLSVQGVHSLRIFGAESQVTFGLALSIPREFAPLITGIIVAGRSGSQLTSRVGSMQLNGELDALKVMGISPIRFVVAPALVALLFGLPILVAIATVSAFWTASLYIEAVLGIAPSAYWADILAVVTMADLIHGFGKAIIFAVLIALIGICKGLRVSGGADRLGAATTSESNKLARLVSSPTILVADGETAEISRIQKARVSRIEQSAGDNGTVLTNTVIDEFLAPFQLTIGEVKINRINKTVQLEVELEYTRFASALSSVTNETDETTDTITTKFWSAPGDVIVLAGLTRNSETTNTTGLPGTTGKLGAIAPALGGSDGIENTLSETIIFMAPTVIDPSAERQPHSAFRTRNRRKAN